MDTFIAAAAGILGALIGGLTTLAVSRQSWNRTLILEVVDDVSQVHEIAWNEVPWRDAQRMETRVRFRLAMLGVSDATADELFDAARACRRSVADQEENGPIGDRDEIGLETSLYDRLERAQKALTADLRRRRTR